MARRRLCRLALAVLLLLVAAPLRPAAAQAPELRVGIGFGVGFLPFYVTDALKLFESRAAAAGVPALKVGYPRFSGSGAMQDALLASSIDIGAYGIPALLIAWDKARASGNAILGLTGVTTLPQVLVTNSPAIRSLKDFGPTDRIAMPSLVSPQMYVLQMAAEQAFGPGQHNRLRGLVVGLPHPDAVNALLSGGTEVTAYFSTPPFTSVVLASPKVQRVIGTTEVFNGPSSFLVLGIQKRFADRNEALTKAIVAAMGDAVALIRDQPRRAAEIYLAAEPSKTLTVESVAALLQDKEGGFGLAPHGTMAYAEFMHRQGEIKSKPARWQDVFLPYVHDQPGS